MRQVIFDVVSEDFSSATVDYWYADEGSAVAEGDDLVELRTEDGGLLTVSAPTAGILRERFFEQGDEVEVGDVIAAIDDGLGGLDDEPEEESKDKGLREETDDFGGNAKF